MQGRAKLLQVKHGAGACNTLNYILQTQVSTAEEVVPEVATSEVVQVKLPK